MSPLVSVVIPVHDAADTLVAQLDAIAAGLAVAPPTEIVVVDNRSTDGSAALARTWAQHAGVDLRVVDAHRRAGEPHARNVGLAAARGEIVLFCDADDEVGPTWVAAMADALDDAHYATGPIDVDRLNEPWLAGVRGRALTEGRSLLYDTVPYAHGCNMGFRRAALAAIGGFDETYAAGCDLDVAIRMWEAGHDLAFREDAVIAYRLRSSLAATWRQGVFYGRFRVRIRRRLTEVGTTGSSAAMRARRAQWLARSALPAVVSRRIRVRWVWVLSQMVGEVRGEREFPAERPATGPGIRAAAS